MRGVKLGVLENPCRHTACDTPGRLQRAAFARVQRVVEDVLGAPLNVNCGIKGAGSAVRRCRASSRSA